MRGAQREREIGEVLIRVIPLELAGSRSYKAFQVQSRRVRRRIAVTAEQVGVDSCGDKRIETAVDRYHRISRRGKACDERG